MTQSLVQEYCLKLMKAKNFTARDAKTFTSFAYKGMRQIVLDKARRRDARIKPELAEEGAQLETPDSRRPELGVDKIWLEAALEKLDEAMPGMGVLADLKYAGYSQSEIAAILEIPSTTVARKWDKCKTFLSARLQGG
jgi:RNA polymerase sigma factor (sigma-70 family)